MKVMIFILVVIIANAVLGDNPLRHFHVEYRLPDQHGIVMGIDTPKPRFSWSYPENIFIHQFAYHIIVVHTLSGVIVWDSGKVEDKNTLHVQYNGEELKSNSRYTVKISSWGEDNNEYTSKVQFHTGFMAGANFTGVWIGYRDFYMNQLRKEFQIPSNFVEATAYISGIGYYELYFNGQNVDPTRKLDPGWTTYEVRTLYSTFNVAPFLTVGNNAIGVLLGNGWYSQDQYIKPAHSKPSYGPPRLLFQLDIKLSSGSTISIVSDPTWIGRQGFIRHDSIYGGETVDARLYQSNWAKPGFKDPWYTWVNAIQLPAPGPTLSAQIMEPIRVEPVELKLVDTWTPATNVIIVDFGQNLAGWIKCNLTGPRGTIVTFRYAEILEQSSSGIYTNFVYRDNLRGAMQTDVYTLNGTVGGEIFEPRFTVHGFRYVEVLNSWSDLKGNIFAIPVHSYSPTAGTFSSDNPVINRIQKNILWGQKSNIMSLPSDCAQRDERKGWMGDAALTIDEALFNFQLAPFYQNWAQNIRDTQTSDGAVGDTTPLTFGKNPADPSWGTAYPTTIAALCDHYGDVVTARDHYPNIKAWVDYLTSRVNQSGIAKMYYSYADWVQPPPAPKTNGSLVSAASYAIDVLNLAVIAGTLGMNSDEQKYVSLYTDIIQAFHKAFYNSSINSYVDRTLTANILALAINAPPPSLKQTVLNTAVNIIYQAGNHSTCGIIGMRYLFPVLSDNGYHDLALKIATQITYPSLGYMFNNPYENATTLWELFNAPDQGGAMNSRNHIMFGSIGSWFYRYVAGIKPNGLGVIEISPGPVGHDSPVKTARATYNSIKGVISVNWEKTKKSYGINVGIPSTTLGRVILPKHDKPYTTLQINGLTVVDFRTGIKQMDNVGNNLGVDSLNLQYDGSIDIRVQPGEYTFLASIEN